MNIAEWLSNRNEDHADSTAIIDNSRGRGRSWTFAEMELSARRIAAQFFNAGLRPGDSIVLLQPISAELYILFMAILRSGMIAVFIDPSAGSKHMDHCCAIHPPRALIGCARAHLLRLLSPALRRIPLKFTTDIAVLGASRLNFQAEQTRDVFEPCTANSPAIIRFTSGTTGKPKGSVRSHGYLYAQQQVLERSFDLVRGETDLVTMPMFVLSNLAAGVTSILPNVNLHSPGLIPANSILHEIRRYEPDRIGAAPALLEVLADFCQTRSSQILCLRKIFTGGGPVFPRLMNKLKAIAPQARIVAVYGSTEAEPIALLEGNRTEGVGSERANPRGGLFVGYCDPSIQIRIVAENDSIDIERSAEALSSGRPGQIVVAGPHVQPNYLTLEVGESTPSTICDVSWHITGDAGYIDEQGRLWLLGRSGSRIQDSRGVIYPLQVEKVAMEIQGVHRAALIAIGGRRVLAVEAKGQIDMAVLESKLGWASIDRIQVVRRIPVDRRHNSKVDYLALESKLCRNRRWSRFFHSL